MSRRALLAAAALLAAGPAWAGTSVSPLPSALAGQARTFSAKTVNMAATGDQATIAIPASITKYQITGVNIANCSATPLLAQPALYTAAAASGTTLVAAAVITGATGTTVMLNSTLAGTVALTALTSASIFVNVSVANATALTCDVYVSVRDLT